MAEYKNVNCNEECPFHVETQEPFENGIGFIRYLRTCKLGGNTDMWNCSIEKDRIKKMRQLMGLAGEE